MRNSKQTDNLRRLRILTAHPWRVILLTLALALLNQVGEQFILRRLGETARVMFDLLTFLILFPLGMWAVFALLDRIAAEREKITLDSDLRSEFGQKLGDAATWDELVRCIIEYIHQVAPEAQATLFAFNPGTLRMDPAAAVKPDGSVVIKPPLSTNPDTLPVGSLPQLLRQSSAGQAIPRSTLSTGPEPLAQVQLLRHRFDLLITRNDQLLGVIKLEHPLGSSASESQVRALKSAAPVMALAIEVALLQKIAAEQAAASTAQRQQIAQNLHDTLAQNISYLRLKLDQLTGANAIHEIGVVLQELERMRAAADEAYQQVRSTLDELNPIQGEDLSNLILKHAQAISSRSGIALRAGCIGEPYPLPPSMRQQILYIVREALYNVEKHSGASEMILQYIWLDSEMMIKITDNGVGFNPRAVSNDGHYGLWIMQHRAQELGGTVKIVPAAEQGTEITLWVPRPGSSAAEEAPQSEGAPQSEAAPRSEAAG